MQTTIRVHHLRNIQSGLFRKSKITEVIPTAYILATFLRPQIHWLLGWERGDIVALDSQAAIASSQHGIPKIMDRGEGMGGKNRRAEKPNVGKWAYRNREKRNGRPPGEAGGTSRQPDAL